MPRRRARFRTAPPSDAVSRSVDSMANLSVPIVAGSKVLLRRAVAMVYRTARQAGWLHDAALDPAMEVYYEARPEACADPSEASHRVMQLISSAVRVDPTWFWKNVRSGLE